MYLIQRANSSEEEGGLPIILINGGPGMPHNYLLPMKVIMTTMVGPKFVPSSKVLACSGRRVVFYDQARRKSQ